MTVDVDLEQIDRGNVVRFTARFIDNANPLAIPTSATLAIAFQKGGAIEKHSYQMAQVGETDEWIYDWDSSATSGGRVDAVAKSAGPVVGAKERSFFVLANSANKPST